MLSEAEHVSRLVREWDERLRRDVSRFDVLAPEAIEAGTLLREPASEDEIREAERRLGRRLPQTYRAFLLTSNGAYASSLGPELQHRGETTRWGFLSVQEIRTMVEEDSWLVDLWTEPDSLMDPAFERRPFGDEFVEVAHYAPTRDAVRISEPWDVCKDLLVPKEGSDEWEFWQFAKEGAVAHRSFAAFLRHQLALPDERPKPELADEYVARVNGGQGYWLRALAEIGDPRVGELAFRMLSDPDAHGGMNFGWTQALSVLGDPAFVPGLRRAYERATSGQLRVRLLDALERCGDPQIEETLRAIAGDPDDSAHSWATFALSRPVRGG